MNNDWNGVRAEFPALKKWTYLNTASHGQIPRRSIDAIARHWARREENACSDHIAWYDIADQVRGSIGRLIHAEAEDIAFVPNAASALGMVAGGIDWKPGDNVVTLSGEFPNYLYFPALVEHRGVEAREVAWDGLFDAIDARTRLVTLSYVNYATGFRLPDDLPRRVHERGARLFIDGTQSIGALEFDAARLQPDVVAVHGYKWMISPLGIGFMYVSPEFRKVLRQTVVGWRSHEGWRNVENLHHGRPVFKESAEKYEGGGLPFGLLDALGTTVNWMLELGPAEIEARVMSLADSARKRLRGLGAEVPESGSQIVSAKFTGCDAPRLVEKLKARKVLVAARREYLRISPHFYNNEEDLDRLEAELRGLL